MKEIIKLILLILIAIPAAILLIAHLGLFSGPAPTDLGVEKNRLKPPSETQNSVSSQAEFFLNSNADASYAKIDPFNYRGSGKAAFAALKEVISANFKEAKLITEKENYLHYEFKTDLIKFTDDVEFLLNENENYIHFRSASRLGRKDFGKNRERMEEIRKKFVESNK